MSISDTNFSHHTETVNGHKIHYVKSGNGAPLLLIHGFPQTWYAWRNIIPILAKEYTVIALDLVGLGDSEPTTEDYDQHTVSKDLFLLMQLLGFEKTNIVAHDLGVFIAYDYAATNNDAVNKLVVLDVPLISSAVEQASVISRENKNLWWFGFHMVNDLPEILIKGNETAYLNYFFKKNTFNKTVFSKEVVQEYVRTYSQPAKMKAALDYYRAFFKNIDFNKELTKIKLTMPILALGGDNSLGLIPMQSFQQVATNVLGGVIENCGHYIPEDQPDELAKRVLAFLK